MKVQITGVTSNQLNIRRKRNPLFSAAKGLLDYFENENYEVENTPNWTDPDVLLYGLYSLNSFVSGGFLKTAKCIDQAITNNKKIIFFVDDWHIDSIGKNLDACSKNIDGYLRFGEKLLGRKVSYEERCMYQRVLNFIMNSQSKILIHVLPWLINDDECLHNFSKSLMMNYKRVILYDPTLFIRWEVPKPKLEKYDKKRAWIVASRYDFTKFVKRTMKPTWPVIYYGCKKIEGAKIVPNEVDLVEDAFRPNWGIVSHPYPEHLQGQWRNKFAFSGISKSIILAYGKEAEKIGSFITKGEIERMNDATLESLAKAQLNEMTQWFDYNESSDRIKGAL